MHQSVCVHVVQLNDLDAVRSAQQCVLRVAVACTADVHTNYLEQKSEDWVLLGPAKGQ